MAKRSSSVLGVAALSIFIAGGVLTFSGIGYLLYLTGFNLFAPGAGSGLALVLIFAGLGLSMAGVFMMRVCRNRWLR